MPAQIRDLSVLAYANGFTLWHYKEKTGQDDGVEQAGFFSPASDMLSAGDMIMVTGTKGGRLLCLVQEATGLRAAAVG